MTAEVCEPLRKHASLKAEWSWNRMYQDHYNKAKIIIKQETCMKFHNTSRPTYLETHASGVSLGARLLQVRKK